MHTCPESAADAPEAALHVDTERTACFICLEEGPTEDGSPVLPRLCACTTLGVHLRCLEALANVGDAEVDAVRKRLNCHVCQTPFKVRWTLVGPPRRSTWTKALRPFALFFATVFGVISMAFIVPFIISIGVKYFALLLGAILVCALATIAVNKCRSSADSTTRNVHGQSPRQPKVLVTLAAPAAADSAVRLEGGASTPRGDFAC